MELDFSKLDDFYLNLSIEGSNNFSLDESLFFESISNIFNGSSISFYNVTDVVGYENFDRADLFIIVAYAMMSLGKIIC